MRAIKDAESEIARLLVNRQVWILFNSGSLPVISGPHVVTSVRQFLPAGEVKNGMERKVSLVDFFTDNGRRVAAVAEIWGRNPEKASKPW